MPLRIQEQINSVRRAALGGNDEIKAIERSLRGFECNGDFSPTTKLATGLVSRFDQFPLPSLPVNHERKSDDWLRKVSESQRNIGFSDRERNFGGFWGGLYRQKLNTAQSLGLVILIVFYVVLFVGLVAQHWPPGPAPVWQKIFQVTARTSYFLYRFSCFSAASMENASSREVAFRD
jgi:hypothetical protein